MLNYQTERNWAKNVHALHTKYNLPLNDETVSNMTFAMWERIVYRWIKGVVFLSLNEACSTNRKTCHLKCSKLMRAPYLTSFKSEVALMVFRERELVFMTVR